MRIEKIIEISNSGGAMATSKLLSGWFELLDLTLADTDCAFDDAGQLMNPFFGPLDSYATVH